jgi:hypothetical protein
MLDGSLGSAGGASPSRENLEGCYMVPITPPLYAMGNRGIDFRTLHVFMYLILFFFLQTIAIPSSEQP